MIAGWVQSLGPWTWIILGLVLAGLELVVPGGVLIWLGIAAIVTGLIDGVLGLSWQISTLVFAGLSVAAVLAGRLISRPAVRSEDASGLNRRGESLIGRTFTLEAPIVGGVGRVRIADSSWRVVGPDTQAGVVVTVVQVDGATLVVERA
jgi:membrane protein implicated in regulation of membrane protease activity